MGDWIICQDCGTLVPHIDVCDVCKNNLPELFGANNVLCNNCSEEINIGEEYCWRCEIKGDI